MTHPSVVEWLKTFADKVGASTLLGERIDAMTREELLGVVGWLIEDAERVQALNRQSERFLTDLTKWGRRA